VNSISTSVVLRDSYIYLDDVSHYFFTCDKRIEIGKKNIGDGDYKQDRNILLLIPQSTSS